MFELEPLKLSLIVTDTRSSVIQKCTIMKTIFILIWFEHIFCLMVIHKRLDPISENLNYLFMSQ